MDFRKLASNEVDLFEKCIRLFEEVFEMENFLIPSIDHLSKVLSDSAFMCFIAIEEQGIAGGLTGYRLQQYYTEKPLFYIYDLAVKQNKQRLGIGQKLIQCVNDYAKENGFEEMYVQADYNDEQAVSFYRKTRISKEEKVLQFSYLMR
ncbi:MAG: GNAT family N-acetyltransferase [Bacteroidota bacterium]